MGVRCEQSHKFVRWRTRLSTTQSHCWRPLSSHLRWRLVIPPLRVRRLFIMPLRRLETTQGLTYNPQTEFIVGNGAKQCVYQGILATCGPWRRRHCPRSYWPSYPEIVAWWVESIVVETTARNGISGHTGNRTTLENTVSS
jgi:hypothetical protein